MADTYINATAGDGTLKIATFNDGSGDHQRMILEAMSGTTPTKLNIGQQTMAASFPVVIASDQSALPISDNGGSITVDGSVSLAAAIPAGTNNIGDVDVASLPAGVIASMSSLPAGTNNIGDVDVLTLPSIPAGANSIGTVGLNSGTNVIGYVRIFRQYSNDTTTIPSASRASGNSADISVALYNSITCFLNVTVLPGTSLDVYVKSKDPISSNYITIGQFAQVTTSTGTWMLALDGSVLGSDIRLEWSIVGANPTFSIGINLKA